MLASCPQQPRATDDFWQVANPNLITERIRTMEQYIYDENNGLWYELHGDFTFLVWPFQKKSVSL